MLKFMKISAKKAGTAPGTLVHVGEQKLETAQISLLQFGPDSLHEQELESFSGAVATGSKEATTWLNITGLHDIDLIERVGREFQIHKLTLEDIVNTRQRAKFEDYGHYLFVVFKMMHLEPESKDIRSEQISLILGSNLLISFQEAPGDVFNPVRERLRKGNGRLRSGGCAYLMYALIDAVVDYYFYLLERLVEEIDGLEEELLDSPRSETMARIHDLKREIIYLRKQVWPMRELVDNMIKAESSFLPAELGIFLSDVHDHTIQVIDTIESLRDVLSSMLDLYLSTVSNRMNEVMKVLTIIATIFIPLTFVAGVYGMNFEVMPELKWRWGYFAVWVVMIAISVGMLKYFKSKQWL